MKKILNHSIAIFVLVALAFFANSVSAVSPAINPPVSAPSSNTPLPIDVGQTANQYIKEGGLGVGTFEAAQNAQFNSNAYFKGIVIGGNPADPLAPEDGTTLAFGGTRSGTVNLTTSGSLGVKTGGLYSSKIVAPSGQLKPVCADTNGDIIFCPEPATCATDPTLCPPSAVKRHYAVAYNMQIGQNIDPHTFTSQSIPNDIVSIDTRNVLVDTLQPGAWSLTTLAHHVTPFAKPVVDSSERIWTVAEDGTYDVAFSANGVFTTYIKPRSQQQMSVNFYLKVNNTLIPLATPKSGGCMATGSVPIVLPSDTQYILRWPCPLEQDEFGWRKHSEKMNYDIAFKQTMTLKKGDQVFLYATGTGYGARNSGIVDGQGSINDEDFTFRINAAALDVTEH